MQAADFDGMTAITWAARNGHEGVVRILLEQKDANPDKADVEPDTTLAGCCKRT